MLLSSPMRECVKEREREIPMHEKGGGGEDERGRMFVTQDKGGKEGGKEGTSQPFALRPSGLQKIG